jgi:CMP-N-acetylneuraminic acid synthetase
VQRLINENLDSIATFHEADINPQRVWKIDAGVPSPFILGSVPWKPRQKLEPAFQLNGAVYAFYPDRLPAHSPSLLFGDMGAEILPTDSVIDIDNLKDFKIANALLST